MSIYKVARGLGHFLKTVFFKYEIVGQENIPYGQRCIVCANHTHNFDPIAINLAMNQKIYFMAKKELFANKFVAKILTDLGGFPIDRGANDLKAIKTALNYLNNDEFLGIFPEGTRNADPEKSDPKAGIAMLAIRTSSAILPIKIKTNKNYRIFSKVKVIIGKPIVYQEYFGQRLSSEDYLEISKDVMNKIYELEA